MICDYQNMLTKIAIIVLIAMMPRIAPGADIKSESVISCVSGEYNLLGRRTQSAEQENVDSSETNITQWEMKEHFGGERSKVKFLWSPKSDKGPTITLETTDRPHNMIQIRSRTDGSLIFVSSTSNFYSAESWTFVINFNVETMMATRVISNSNGVGSEQITYNCRFEAVG